MIIDEKTVIDNGFRLSRRFNIDHLTCGGYNGYFGRKMPVFRHDLDFHDKSSDGKKLLPKWKIAANLKNLCDKVLEPLTDTFGQRLLLTNVYSSYSRTNTTADESRHLIGSAVDFTILGSVEDMYYPAQEAYQVVRNAIASFRLVYGETSWIHIGIEPIHSYGTIGKKDFGVSTLDLMTGEMISATPVVDEMTGRQFLRNQLGELFDPDTGQFEHFDPTEVPVVKPSEIARVAFARPRGPTGDDWFLDAPTDPLHKFNQRAIDDPGFV